ncbi:DUF4192 family protein [Streptomyces marispadix]|uniref:DUF4192 domain-containing protein n=1 Tax=Streptomyces marispadix TaxID=2922868 RepID=A0ABS9T3F1_9ACTN|nr:DUF4192 family protein [Streptomyces marispadix]MCH6163037.1 DUF4192 domain-containing protein [Streptomyces marispadix]
MTQRDNGHPSPSDDDTGDAAVREPQAQSGSAAAAPAPESEIALRGPAELADALPYLLGFYPDDSIVVVALHGRRGRFGGRIRLGIPAARDEWSAVSQQVATCLEGEVRSSSGRPDGAIVFLCQEPGPGQKRER